MYDYVIFIVMMEDDFEVYKFYVWVCSYMYMVCVSVGILWFVL